MDYHQYQSRYRRRRKYHLPENGVEHISPKTPKRTLRKIVKTALLAMILIFGAVFLWIFFSTSSTVFNFVLSSAAPLGQPLKTTDGRVNVLMLGIGGGNHDGADLTDSIIIASYDLKTNTSTLISVPRDLWLTSIKEKVNAAYELGKINKTKVEGLKYAEAKLSDISGVPISYGILIDFNGFAQAVDQVGGVDVNVENSFDDYHYPITGKEDDMCGYQDTFEDLSADQAKALNVAPGKTHVYVDPSGKVSTDSAILNFSCRYEHIHFEKGLTHMDGATALTFVRSRHGDNGEGSDFARSRRQQLVLEAFRKKVLSLNTLANPQKIIGLVNTLGSSVVTDIPADKYLDFYKLIKNMNSSQNIVLGDLGNGKSVFINPPVSEYGAWVLIPPNNDFTPVKNYIQSRFAEEATQSASISKQKGQ